MTAQSGIDKPFAERCLRGLRDKEFIHRDENGKVFISELAFKPPTKTSNLENRVNHRHKSSHYELSINWEDHATESFRLLCDDKDNAKYGIVRIRLTDLKTAKNANPLAATYFDWERDQTKANPFHGNLLFSGELPPPVIRMLAAVVATHVQDKLDFIEPEKYEAELATRATQTTTAGQSSHLGTWQRFIAKVRAVLGL